MGDRQEGDTTRRCASNDVKYEPKDGPVLVSIHYFKPTSGKWYCEDEDVEWKPDPNHFTGWQNFRELHRLKDMMAVCLVNPLGFPQSSPGDLSKWDPPNQRRADAPNTDEKFLAEMLGRLKNGYSFVGLIDDVRERLKQHRESDRDSGTDLYANVLREHDAWSNLYRDSQAENEKLRVQLADRERASDRYREALLQVANCARDYVRYDVYVLKHPERLAAVRNLKAALDALDKDGA